MSEKKLKKTLVILSPGFAENEGDTTCLPFLQTLVKALNRNEPFLKIIIVAFQYPFTRGVYYWHGNTVIGLGGKGRAKIYRILVWIRAFRSLAKINKANEIEGMLSLWMTECAMVGKYFAQWNHKRHFTWILGQDALASNKYVKYVAPKPSSIVAMSDFLVREFHKNHGIRPEHVIVDGIEPSLFSLEMPEREIDILGVGSLIPLKQYDVFIEVIYRVKSRFPDIQCVLCGKGPEEKKLRELIEKYKLEDNIVLMGEVPHLEVLRLMQRSKVFLHTSNYEGFATVCAEALYAGCNVVGFTKPMDIAIKQWYHAGNTDEMVEKVLLLLEDKSLKHERVIVKTMDEIAGEFVALFMGH